MLTYVVIFPLLTIFANICLESDYLPRAIFALTENQNYPNSILDQKFKSFGLNDVEISTSCSLYNISLLI